MPTTSRTPNKTRQLTASGIKAQEHYLRQGLDLLHKHGTLRAKTLAFALFPNRSEKAAMAAAYRVLANASEQGLIEFADEKKSRHRYYALGRVGAAYLRSTSIAMDAVGTTALLNKSGAGVNTSMVKARHREWTNVLAIAAILRGLKSWSETSYPRSGFRADVSQNIAHVPDALTVISAETDGGGDALAIWHEVELSRRSVGPDREVKQKDPKTGKVRKVMVQSGRTKLLKLVAALRDNKVILNQDGEPHTVRLMFHCATPLIADEVASAIVRAYGGIILEDDFYRALDEERRKIFRHLTMPFDTGLRKPGQAVELLHIHIELLPHRGNIEMVWHDSLLPWAGAGPAIYPKFGEQFVRTVGEGTRT